MKRIGDMLPNLPSRRLPDAVPAPAPAPVECPICQDIGFLRADVEVGHPLFGEPIPCECTLRKRKAAEESAFDRGSSLNAFTESEFDDFDPEVTGAGEAFDAAWTYAHNPFVKPWLLLTGPVGVGKTHLAVAVGKHFKETNNLEVIFAVVPDLLDHLRSAFNPSAEIQYDDRFNRIKSVPMLILDDLGTENATPWAREKLFQIINHRYTERFPTIITTNVDLAKIDDRIASRIMDSRLTEWVQIDAADFRRPGFAPKLRRPRRG
jgi:DNA replication protein DnaC